MKLSVFLEDELSITKGSIKLNIKSQLEKYREKYEALIAKKKLVVDYYRIMPSKTAIIWVKVPSQSLDKFYYDVLIQLTPVDGAAKFEDCEVKFFSNSPSFVYGGYAYIFYHMDSDPNAPDGKALNLMPEGAHIFIVFYRHFSQHQRFLFPCRRQAALFSEGERQRRSPARTTGSCQPLFSAAVRRHSFESFAVYALWPDLSILLPPPWVVWDDMPDNSSPTCQ